MKYLVFLFLIPLCSCDKPENVNFVTILTEKANQDDAVAQFLLGEMFLLGKGVKQDYNQAFEWFQKSANQGFPEAQYELALLYAKGKGFDHIYSKSLGWKGVDQVYGYFIRTNISLLWLKKSANQGYRKAKVREGWVTYSGYNGGVKQDDMACSWIKDSADKGDKLAQETFKKYC